VLRYDPFAICLRQLVVEFAKAGSGQNSQGIYSMYFHLDSIAVKDGQTVARGDIIGHVGATGRATGPHLHWGIRIQDTPVDPLSLLTLFEK